MLVYLFDWMDVQLRRLKILNDEMSCILLNFWTSLQHLLNWRQTWVEILFSWVMKELSSFVAMGKAHQCWERGQVQLEHYLLNCIKSLQEISFVILVNLYLGKMLLWLSCRLSTIMWIKIWKIILHLPLSW